MGSCYRAVDTITTVVVMVWCSCGLYERWVRLHHEVCCLQAWNSLDNKAVATVRTPVYFLVEEHTEGVLGRAECCACRIPHLVVCASALIVCSPVVTDVEVNLDVAATTHQADVTTGEHLRTCYVFWLPCVDEEVVPYGEFRTARYLVHVEHIAALVTTEVDEGVVLEGDVVRAVCRPILLRVTVVREDTSERVVEDGAVAHYEVLVDVLTHALVWVSVEVVVATSAGRVVTAIVEVTVLHGEVVYLVAV